MDTATIILIGTNIVTPITASIITAVAQAKKYKKEIELLNVQHNHREEELRKDYEHQLEIEKLRHHQQQELEAQRTGNMIVEKLTEKMSDAIMHQPATQKMINQRTQQAFIKRKR